MLYKSTFTYLLACIIKPTTVTGNTTEKLTIGNDILTYKQHDVTKF